MREEIILFSPLAGFLIISTIGRTLPNIFVGWIGVLSVFISFLASISHPTSHKIILEWIPEIGAQISVNIDNLSRTALYYITGVSTLIHIYSVGYMWNDKSFKRFFALLNLFVFFMLNIVLADNLLQLFLGWEGVGLCSYLLIGFWWRDFENARAGLKAFLTNRIGDAGFIIGIGLYLLKFKTLFIFKNYGDGGEIARWISFFLFLGAMGKSAQGPLWLWLPDAMRGPTPVSALIHAATMVTAGVYMVLRIPLLNEIREFIFYTGILTSILTAIFGLFEKDLKRILAFSTLSQLGLMFSGAVTYERWVGMFHIFEHAFFKACLFLIAGNLMHHFHEKTDIFELREERPKEKGMILSYIGFLISALSMAGIFPTAGYFSKSALAEAVSETFGKTGEILIYFATFLTPLYIFRAFFIVFGEGKVKVNGIIKQEGGFAMFFAVFILTILSLIGGILDVGKWLGENFGYTPKPHHFHTSHQIVAISAIIISSIFKGGKKLIPEKGLGMIFWKKFFLNEIEENIFIGLGKLGISISFKILETLLEFFYFLLTKISEFFSLILRKIYGFELSRILIFLLFGFVLFWFLTF